MPTTTNSINEVFAQPKVTYTQKITPVGEHNVYAGEPDSRQGDGHVTPSRFRPTYKALTAEQIALHNSIKEHAVVMENLFNKVPHGPYSNLAITALEESVMWIVKQLTA